MRIQFLFLSLFLLGCAGPAPVDVPDGGSTFDRPPAKRVVSREQFRSGHPISAIAMSESGIAVASATKRSVSWWQNEERQRIIYGYSASSIHDINNGNIVFAYSDGQRHAIVQWEPFKVPNFHWLPMPAKKFAVASNGNLLAATQGDAIKVWETKDWKTFKLANTFNDPVVDLAMSSDGDIVAYTTGRWTKAYSIQQTKFVFQKKIPGGAVAASDKFVVTALANSIVAYELRNGSSISYDASGVSLLAVNKEDPREVVGITKGNIYQLYLGTEGTVPLFVNFDITAFAFGSNQKWVIGNKEGVVTILHRQ